MNAIKLLLHRTLKPIAIEDVFTPSSSAVLTYVQRPTIERKFHSQFKLCGKQIIVYGHSGCGKTTFVNRYLKDHKIESVTINCDSSMSIDQIILNTFDQLGQYYKQSTSSTNSQSLSSTLGVKADNTSAQVGSSVSSSETSNFARIVSPQITPQRLAETLGKANKMLIIEDFHKLPESEKKKLADMLKIFIDQANKYPSLKVVCIGAVDTAREIVKLDSNLKQRVYECEIPLLNDKEIQTIIERGCELLNIEMTPDLVERIVHYSNQLGSIAHQLSYDLCEAEDIHKTRFKKRKLGGEHFKNAVEAYIDARSDTLMELYERAVKDSLGWYILRTFSNNPQSRMNLKVIRKKVNTTEHPFTDEEITQKLAELSTSELGILRSNYNGAYYTISDPFWGAFIKMRIAKEQADKAKTIHNMTNRNLQLQNQNDVEAMLLQILINKYSIKN